MGRCPATLPLEGRPLAYNARPDVLNPHFLAFADDATDWRALLE